VRSLSGLSGRSEQFRRGEVLSVGRPSKFTAARRELILELLAAGASRRAAAAAAGIGHQTLLRWVTRGEAASEGSRWHNFYLAVEEAEARPRLRALSIVYNAIPDDPSLAWKFIERTVEGFGSIPEGPAPRDPEGVIHLHLPGNEPLGDQ
jgi:hypothetical protein